MACVHYFQKKSVFLHYFERSTLKRNLTYHCFIFPSFHKNSLMLELLGDSARDENTYAHKKSMTRNEQTNQAKTEINITKGLKT